MSSSPPIPSNVKLKFTFLHNTERKMRKLFASIMDDYCRRFGVGVTTGRVTALFSGVGEMGDRDFSGVTFEGNGRYLVSVYDPALDQDSDPSEHHYVAWAFVTSLCHEMVHVMQGITGRIPKIEGFPPMSDEPDELYFFDPFEIEARILEGFYAAMFGEELRHHIESE